MPGMTKVGGLAFLPMHHLMPAFEALAFMQRDVHSKPMLSRAFLFSGPAGTGKSHMVQVFAKRMTIENTEAADGRLTLCCATNLKCRALSNTSSVQEWLFSEVAKELRGLGRHLPVARALERLAASAKGQPSSTISHSQLMAILSGDEASGAGSSALPQEVCAALRATQSRGRFAMANALLRQANVVVIAHIDEAECIFQGGHFTLECASQWCAELRELVELSFPAVGVVMCTSFQRARELFFSDEQPSKVPRKYTHLELVRDWGNSNLSHIRLGNPAWTATSLAAFLLTCACKMVDPAFCLFGRSADEQPSAAALEVARKLDALFLCDWEGSRGLGATGNLHASLNRILERFGHTPRDLNNAVLQAVVKVQSPWALHDSRDSIGTATVQPGSENVQQIVEALFSLLPSKEKGYLAGETMLSFHSATYAVPIAMLEQKLGMQLAHQQHLTSASGAGGDAACKEASLSHQPAIQLIHDAIDAGWLVWLGEEVGLDSLRVFRQFTNGCVRA